MSSSSSALFGDAETDTRDESGAADAASDDPVVDDVDTVSALRSADVWMREFDALSLSYTRRGRRRRRRSPLKKNGILIAFVDLADVAAEKEEWRDREDLGYGEMISTFDTYFDDGDRGVAVAVAVAG